MSDDTVPTDISRCIYFVALSYHTAWMQLCQEDTLENAFVDLDRAQEAADDTGEKVWQFFVSIEAGSS